MFSRLALRRGAPLMSFLLIGAVLMTPASAEAAVEVSAAASIVTSTPTSVTVEVTGTGYSTSAPGIYVGVSESGGASASDPSVYRGTEYLPPTKIAEDGSFAVTLMLDATDIATLDRGRTYAVYTLKAHGAAASDPSQNAEVPLPLDFSTLADPKQEPELEPDPDSEPDQEPEPEQEPEAAVPAVTLSDSQVSSDGPTTVTVTGTGFDPSLATGVRPPLAGKAAGAYVVFGKFAQTWRPSEGAGSATRVNAAQKWAVPAESMPTIGGAGGGAVELSADGSFTAQVVIDKSAIDAKATAESLVNYGVYTYPGSGATASSYETYTPITFVDPEPTGPSLDIDVTEAVEGALTVDVSGSGYLEESPGVYVGIAPSGGASPTDASVYGGTQWVMHTAFGAGGTFERTLSLDADDIAMLDGDASYSVYTFRAHGLAATDPSQTVEVPLGVDIATLQPEAEPQGPALEVSVTESIKGRLKVQVTGRQFARTFPGVYVGLSKSGGADPSDAGAYRGTVWVSDTSMDDAGGFTRELVLDAATIATLDPAESYSVYALRAHGFPDLDPSQSIEAALDLDIAALQGTTPDPGTDPDPDPETTPTPGAGSTPTSRGSLVWGVKASFRSYVTGPIARGSIAVSNGASASGSTYRFFQRSTTAADDRRGTTRYGGTVRFTGHGGALDLRLTDPTVVVTSARSASLTMIAGGTRIRFATVDLAAASTRSTNGATTFRAAPARLTAAGAAAFKGFYSAGEALDPVTFTVGANGGAATSARTVSTVRAADRFVPPAAPPATTGATLEVEDPDGVRAGDQITVTADGFAPNESDIAVVVYSTPVVLDRSAEANASGRVTWTGFLPGDLEEGQHTLTLQGSVDRGVTFDVADARTTDRCEVADSTLTWGVKESFRSYVSGTIANGEWTTSGRASYETPDFTFDGGAGQLDHGAGEVAFEGAIRFTGHAGALAVTMADPQVRLVDDDTAVLFLDVTAADRASAEAGDAAATTSAGVPFVELDLAAADRVVSGDRLTTTFTDVPTALTEQGHGVFSDYATGESFDPIDLVVTTGEDCGAALIYDESDSSQLASGDIASSTTDAGIGGWWWIAIAGLVVLAAVGGIGVGRRMTPSDA